VSIHEHLADGDDGVALARDLKVMGVPVLFIGGQPDRAQLEKAAAVASLAKPYSAPPANRRVSLDRSSNDQRLNDQQSVDHADGGAIAW